MIFRTSIQLVAAMVFMVFCVFVYKTFKNAAALVILNLKWEGWQRWANCWGLSGRRCNEHVEFYMQFCKQFTLWNWYMRVCVWLWATHQCHWVMLLYNMIVDYSRLYKIHIEIFGWDYTGKKVTIPCDVIDWILLLNWSSHIVPDPTLQKHGRFVVTFRVFTLKFAISILFTMAMSCWMPCLETMWMQGTTCHSLDGYRHVSIFNVKIKN